MHTIEVTRKFATETPCLDYLEQMRWPDEDSMYCRRKGCGVVGKKNFTTFTTNETKRQRFSKKKNKIVEVRVPSRRLFQCKECGYQFSVKVDTVFHDSHLPLDKWFAAVALMIEAKKGVSAMQMCRHLGVDPKKNYKTVWYLCHRIREAMVEAGFEFLTGVVEVDETYFSPRKPRKGKPYTKNHKPMVVLAMRQRGGDLRLVRIKDAKMSIIEPELVKHISPDATLQTDGHPSYYIIGQRDFVNHRMIDHIRSYAEGENHTNTVESAFSLLKKGVYGTFHKVSIKHLGRYCNEFSYRFNRRDSQKQMFDATMKGLLRAKPLSYKKLTSAEVSPELSNPSDPGF